MPFAKRSRAPVFFLALLALAAVLVPARALRAGPLDALKDALRKAGQKSQGTAAAIALAPRNDNFASREKLVGEEVRVTADNRTATIEPGEPSHTPGWTNAKTVWWSWMAPATGKVTIDTLGITGGTRALSLTFYLGDSLADLLPVVRKASLSEDYKLEFPVEGGRTYQIAFNGFDDNGNRSYVGQISFNLRFAKTTSPPPILGRDNFADRAVLKGNEAFAVANNQQSTIEPREPDHLPGQRNLNTVWWSWTAPTTGKVTIDMLGITGGPGSTCLIVYTGDALDSLVSVASGNAATDNYKLGFPVEGGRTYHIVSDCPNDGYFGQISFNLHFHAAPGSQPRPEPRAQPKRPAPKPRR